MAKGLRAKSRKSNKQKLRSRVFAPVELARKERLSSKLLELANQEAKLEELTTSMHAQNGGKGDSAPLTGESEGEMVTDSVSKAHGEKTPEPVQALEVHKVRKKKRQGKHPSIVFSTFRQGRRMKSSRG